VFLARVSSSWSSAERSSGSLAIMARTYPTRVASKLPGPSARQFLQLPQERERRRRARSSPPVNRLLQGVRSALGEEASQDDPSGLA
jgi:hypothetical protein